MKILIADDEAPARERLQGLLQNVDKVQVVGVAGNGAEVLAQYNRLHPEMVLLDIRMPGMDGLETARHLSTLPEPPAIIFTTAYAEHALQAFEAHAVDYLLKPIRAERLAQAIRNTQTLNRAQITAIEKEADKDRPKTRTHICVQTRGNLKLAPVDEILFFRAEQKYVTVCYRGGELLIEESLKSLEVEFADYFLRIHRNALISYTYLSGMEKDTQGRCQAILLGTEQRIEISRRHVSGVRRFLKKEHGAL